jgi:hypothetical protein
MPALLTCSLLWLQSTAAPPSATLKVFGAVAHPTRFSAAEIATAHNQAGKYAGISMRELQTRVGVPTGADLRGAELAKTVIVTGADGYKCGAGVATVGEREAPLAPGSTIYIPRNVRITLKNTGTLPMAIAFVFSKPGFEDYLRDTSVPERQPVPPLSDAELARIRQNHMSHTVYEQ